jgi:hypothetical protein
VRWAGHMGSWAAEHGRLYCSADAMTRLPSRLRLMCFHCCSCPGSRALQRQPVQAVYLAVDALMLALSIIYSESNTQPGTNAQYIRTWLVPVPASCIACGAMHGPLHPS